MEIDNTQSFYAEHDTEILHFKLVLHTLTESEKVNDFEGQQNLLSFHSQPIAKDDDALPPLVNPGLIGRSIGSNSGLERMMNREQ
jgi:hypothetical protein